ncbi:MAG: hypothetical protein MUP55_00505 [Candidatus Aenigmarchaeota archaeon]|nr:hypothetical protein [Candidatus Aenigmarchaeota archaeon]
MDTSLVFGIIFTIIVMAALLVFGWDQIANLFGFGGEAQTLRSIDNLNKKIDFIYRNAEGSRTEFTLAFPKDYKLCFFNSSNPAPKFYSDRSKTWNPDQTVKFRINQSGYNSWYYKGADDAGGHGYNFAYLDIPTEKNFCAVGGTKLSIINRGYTVEVEAV